MIGSKELVIFGMGIAAVVVPLGIIGANGCTAENGVLNALGVVGLVEDTARAEIVRDTENTNTITKAVTDSAQATTEAVLTGQTNVVEVVKDPESADEKIAIMMARIQDMNTRFAMLEMESSDKASATAEASNKAVDEIAPKGETGSLGWLIVVLEAILPFLQVFGIPTTFVVAIIAWLKHREPSRAQGEVDELKKEAAKPSRAQGEVDRLDAMIGTLQSEMGKVTSLLDLGKINSAPGEILPGLNANGQPKPPA